MFAFGDLNVPAEVLKASGMLEAYGLEIIIPEGQANTCLAGKGSVIDYVVCTKEWGRLVRSCEVVYSVPCGTHLGVRTTFVADAEDVFVTGLRKPKTLAAAVAHFKAADKVDTSYEVPTWEAAVARSGKSRQGTRLRASSISDR